MNRVDYNNLIVLMPSTGDLVLEYCAAVQSVSGSRCAGSRGGCPSSANHGQVMLFTHTDPIYTNCLIQPSVNFM